ncbi:MAG: SDR family NAD(P)-dependent oxidoreductase [Melioribacteraceae bacterium]|nr:SDR family NAD(P)-dependent oxidoreductase [Melioribacteraceae bacterium]
MQTVLVTGAAGFIGSHFAKKMLENNYRVISIDNLDDFYDVQIKKENLSILNKHELFKHFTGDIRDRKFINTIFSNNVIDLVAHFAAKAGVRPSIINPIEYFDVNVQGTINILEAMKKFNVGKMIFASSSSVYGNNRKVPFSESDNVDNPVSPYAASKKACELICSTYNSLHAIDIFAFRFFTVYGPAQRPEMAIAKFTDLIYNGKPVTLFDGKGLTGRDYTYIDDIIQGLYYSVDKIKGFEIFNLGESQVIKLIDLVRIIEKELGRNAEIIFGNKQPGDVDITFADIDKARRVLQYNPGTDITNGIKKYCEWYFKAKN